MYKIIRSLALIVGGVVLSFCGMLANAAAETPTGKVEFPQQLLLEKTKLYVGMSKDDVRLY